MTAKLVSVAEAADLVQDGSVLAVGGVMEQMVPVTFLLELARRRARDLHCVAVAAGLSMDLAIGSGIATEASCAIVSFEDLGTSTAFRRRVENGQLKFREHTELTMITRLNAAASGVPFLPTRAALGTDVAADKPTAMRMMECPFTGARLLACAALEPDVAVIHVDRADTLGNAQLLSKHIWHDIVIARAAKSVVVTAEEIVSEEEIRRTPECTVLPSFVVDAVVAAPGGARPTMCPGRYEVDRSKLVEWLSAASDDLALENLVAEWIRARTVETAT